MTITPYVSVFLLCHVLGDFYFQSQALSQKKQTSWPHLLLHGLLYALPFVAAGIYITLYTGISPWMPIGIAVIAHLLIDILKRTVEHTIPSCVHRPWPFLLDQLLHLAIVFWGGWYMGHRALPLPTADAFRWILFFLLLLRPVNIALHELFYAYQPKTEGMQHTQPGAGAIIGSMERILVALCFIVNQYALIGLVITAKSIARFKRISEDQEFAEYYLIGTLFSILSAMVLAMIFF